MLKSEKASSTMASPTNWQLCALCQEHSDNDLLRDARRASNQSSREVYEKLAQNLRTLHDLGALPCGINISRLDEGCGIAETLALHAAKWHKKCYRQCCGYRVGRAESVAMKQSADNKLDDAAFSPVRKRLRTSLASSSEEQKNTKTCFFCDDVITNDQVVHRAATINLDSKVRMMATELRETKLLTKLSVGDMTASGAVYHKKCLTALYTRYRSFERKKEVLTSSNENMQPESVALAELISHLEEMKLTDGSCNAFKLADLVKLYTERLKQLGGDISKKINSTHIKDKLLRQLPYLEAHTTNYEVVLSFKEDTGDTLLNTCRQGSDDDDAVILMRAAKIVRRDILERHHLFNGSLLDESCNTTAQSLTTLMQMILVGTNIKKQMTKKKSIHVQSISQLVTFNTVKRGRPETARARHSLERETSLPVYLGLLIHNKTRKRDLVDILFQHGLSVSYDRVLQISVDEANKAIEVYENDRVVCPTKLRSGLFTTGNLDNIDHDPSAGSSRTSFHGTAISLTQHVSQDNKGTVRNHENVAENGKSKHRKTIDALPTSYSDVPPAAFPSNQPIPRKPKHQSTPTVSTRIEDKDSQWLSFVHKLRENGGLEGEKDISWSAYMANLQVGVPRPPAITGLLPMFRESAHTLEMVKHGMNSIKQAAELLNPGQVPVLTVDQPLYAIAKKIQWTWPNVYGEDKFVVMMGGLHIEMALLKVIGDFLEGSGWTSVITNAGVTTEGRAESLQKGSQTSRAQWAHQVTAAALHSLQQSAYQDYVKTCASENIQSFDAWKLKMATDYPQFCYWNKVLQLECLLLAFLRSQREANYMMYVEALKAIIPWLFAMDHYHYSAYHGSPGSSNQSHGYP
ncbi:uncharacterized protein LOC135154778 [Lytechinus pictus]|uniref:uncharacterized protein LOC135154778 n=1 Tax=Lytechinus pictus TaxID=7653 RepID=UPI0030B9D269